MWEGSLQINVILLFTKASQKSFLKQETKDVAYVL